MRGDIEGYRRSTGLVDVLDRVLEQIGLDWWRWEPNLSGRAKKLAEENDTLRADLRRLQDRLEELEAETRGKRTLPQAERLKR
jgi:hypothetical protein